MIQKFTPGAHHAIEVSGYWIMADEPYYEANNLLDAECVGSETAEANAKLYAASPDLLESLQLAVQHLEETDFDVSGTPEWMMEKFKAAIRKASNYLTNNQ